MTYRADQIAQLVQDQMPYGQEPDTTFWFPDLQDAASFATDEDYAGPDHSTRESVDVRKAEIREMQTQKVRVSGWLSKHTSRPGDDPGPYQGELTLNFLPPNQRDARLVWSFDGEPHEISKALCVPFRFKRANGHRDGEGRTGYLLIGFVGSGQE